MSMKVDNIKKNILGYGLIGEQVKLECWRLRGFFYIGAYTHLSVGSNVWNAIIGRYSRIDPNVTIGFRLAEGGIFSNHYFSYAEDYVDSDSYKSFKAIRFYYDKQNITFIGNDVRIHQGSIICAGISIGNGAIVYPNSVVDSDVPPYAIVAGNPAKIIKYRFSNDVISKISSSNWFLNDLSGFERLVDYSNINDVLLKLSSRNINNNNMEMFHVNSYTNVCDVSCFRRLVIGPSHIDMWQSLVNSGRRAQPKFLMHGANGLSLYSTRLKSLMDFFIRNSTYDIVLLVPDFRIGNVMLNKDVDVYLDPLFISKDNISPENDIILYELAINILDEFVLNFRSRVKFIFWCLVGREYENKKIGKYVVDGYYRHPSWNYSEIKNRYSENILEIPDIEGEIGDYIYDNNTIHPNDRGYDILEKYISRDLS